MKRIDRWALALSTFALIGGLAASAGAQSQRPAGNPVSGDAESAGSRALSAASAPSGEQTYMRVCAACHMPDARGAVGAGFYPALARNEKLAAGGYPVYVVMKGLHGMPAVGEMMTDQQVADVVNYVRTHFGNRYRDAVKPADVAALR